MDLHDYLRVLRKRWRLVTLCTLLALAGSATATLLTTPTYQATAQLFISAQAATDLSVATQGSNFALQRVTSYADIVASPMVTQPVIDELHLATTTAELAGQIKASNPPNTVLLNISVSDPDPRLARDITNAVAAQFTQVVKQLESPEGSGTALVKATVVQVADTPIAPVSPRKTVNLALGLLVGLAIGVGAAVLRETLDTTLKSPTEAKEASGAPVLGVVPEDPKTSERPLVTEAGGSASPRSEAYRQIRTNLQFVDVDRPVRTVVLTSAIPEEGKTTTACNLAIAMAEAGKRVVLMEADLRRPRTAEYFGLEGGVGVTNVLLGQTAPADVLQQWGRLPLWVLPSGPIPPNPSELLGSHQMATLLKTIGAEVDLVILDAPPLLPVTDAAVLATQCDGALLVARHGHTHRDQLAGAAAALQQVGAHLFGVIINRVPTRGGEGRGYGYAYGYGYGYSSSSGRPRLTTSLDLESSSAGPDGHRSGLAGRTVVAEQRRRRRVTRGG